VTEASAAPQADQNAAAEAGPPLVLCLINEAWFFRSHFLPWARLARAGGLDVIILATPERDAQAFGDGIALVASRASRGGLLPRGLWGASAQVRALAAGRRSVIVHAFGLHGMAIAALARLRGVRRPLAVSVTGLGFFAAKGAFRRAFGMAVVRMLGLILEGPSTRWLVENSADLASMGLHHAVEEGRVTVLTGAGVDPSAFAHAPMPARPPLKLVLVARMVRSKGVDLAVAAVARARQSGSDVTLTLVGDRDGANPASYSEEDMARFAATPGVHVLGRRTDIAALLADHHLFILPSRGGEGLPKALLEAAAASRPAIVTDVPGCRDFVQPGATGYVVAAGSVAALAEAIAAAGQADLPAMGRAARERVELTGSTEVVGSQVVRAYLSLLDKA
jgi:glycosyltransferase involved in cell wall biosynthesis